jgi:SAM-dependent methyltransferase
MIINSFMDKIDYSSLLEFLASKKSVDDRSLNKNVWDAMLKNLKQIGHPEIIEIGSGTGTMLTRLLDTGPPYFSAYTAVDRDPLLISESKKNAEKWALKNKAVYTHDLLRLEGAEIKLDFVTGDIENFLERNAIKKSHDLLIANAFLDLVNIPEILPGLFGTLTGKGMFYFSINYDGRTDIEPVIDKELDAEIIELYHKTVDQRLIKGVKCCTRYSGLLLFNEIIKNKGVIVEVGSSDWCVFPRDNKYRFREDYFLHYIIDTIENALYNEPSLSREILLQWINKRHQQIDRGELIFITHQLDLFGHIRD